MQDVDAMSTLVAEHAAAPLSDGEWEHVVSALGLSSQQARIVELILEEKSDKEVAREMGLRVPTVRTHLARLFQRTGATSRVGLVLRVIACARAWREQSGGHRN